MNQAFEPACTPIAPPWEAPQVIPAQLRRHIPADPVRDNARA